jgi:hypothetical protein
MSALSSEARVLASTLSVFTFASAMRRVLDGLDRATSNPCSSSLSWIGIQRFPVDSTTALTSSWRVVSLPANSSISPSHSRIASHRVELRPRLGWRLDTSFYGRLFPHISRVSPRVACGRHAPIGSLLRTSRVTARVWPSLA